MNLACIIILDVFVIQKGTVVAYIQGDINGKIANLPRNSFIYNLSFFNELDAKDADDSLSLGKWVNEAFDRNLANVTLVPDAKMNASYLKVSDLYIMLKMLKMRD